MQDAHIAFDPIRRVPRLKIFIAGVLAAALLSGCSIWPKALTFGAKAEPEQTQAAAPAPTPEPMPAPAQAPAESKPEVAVAPVTTPVVKEAASPAMPVPMPAPLKMEPAPKVVVVSPTIPNTKLLPGLYINVGLFAVPSNGTNAHLKLDKAGLPVLTDSLQTKKGILTRVRVGPFSTRPEAETAAKQIRDLQLEAIIFKR